MRRLAMLMLALLLSACGGGGGGSSGSSNNSSSSSKVSSEQELFTQRVQPQLDNCRTCHVPGGVADTDKGRRMMLSSNRAEDYDRLKASWTTLGKGVETSRILLKASNTDAEAHTGGTPWPKNGDAYNNARALLGCWDDPGNCASILAALGGGVVAQLPLLGNPGKHFFVSQLCDGQPDSTPIDWNQDPRRLLTPQAGLIDSEQYAVHFNDPYELCHTEDLFKNQAKQNALRREGKSAYLGNVGQQGPEGATYTADGSVYTAKRDPATCGEWRQRVQAGHDFINTVPTTGGALPVAGFRDLWKAWGLSARPADFEEQVSERYGLQPTPRHVSNPYPLNAEEDARLSPSFGGSGQLPLGMAQSRDASGKYDGQIGINCFVCHAGKVGSGEIAGRDANGNAQSYGANPWGSFMGLANSNQDVPMMISDTAAMNAGGAIPAWFAPGNINTTRGTHNADIDIELAVAVKDFDTDAIAHAFAEPIHNNYGDQDSPTWWWLHNKTRYLWFGGHSTDSARGNMYFGAATTGFSGDYAKSREGIFEDVHQWTLTIEAPDYPGPIDTALAEQGAVLFHEKDLWAGGGNDDIPRPQGNGSCAGCHGAYSPRYAADKRFLPDARLAGTTGYTVPIEILDTDPIQAEGWAKFVRPHVSTFWWSYPDAMPDYLAPEEKTPLQEELDDYALTDGISGASVADYLGRLTDRSGALQPLSTAMTQLGQLLNPVTGVPLGETLGRIKGACAFEEKTVGYVTPPLHGVWASAPYFHNGSLPTVWDILKPQDRPPVWRRQRSPEGVTSGPWRGFDANLARAYDYDKLGWKYERLNCSDGGQGIPYYSCQPDQPAPQEAIWVRDLVGGNLLWPTWGLITPIGPNTFEDRMIFNTNMTGKKNTGHAWTKVLSDPERRALIEYLKTL